MERTCQYRLARRHPTDIAPNGVDLTVVCHIAVRVRQLPTGKRVGREPLVHQAQCAGDQRIGQLEVEFFNLRSQHQALVNDGTAGERGDVEGIFILDLGSCNLVLGAAADPVEKTLETVLVQLVRTRSLGPAHEELLDVGLRGSGFATDRVAVDGGIAPAEDGEALLLGIALKDALTLQAAVFVYRKEDHGHAIGAGLRQLHPKLATFARKEDVRNLNQDASAVASLRVATGSAAMSEVDEDLKALADDIVAFFAADAGDQSHSAGIVLVAWVIKTLRLRIAETTIRCMHGSLFDELFLVQNALLARKTQLRCDSFPGDRYGFS